MSCGGKMSCDEKCSKYECGWIDRTKKRWMKDYMSKEGVNTDMRADRGEWKRKTFFADPT